jgi:DNA-directed RNA polymerase subunit RPC12/RpoP
MTPVIGETKSGFKAGKHDGHKYIWQACITCGQEMWIPLRVSYMRKLCKSCNYKSLKLNIKERNTNYRGGKTHEGGYVYILLYPDDFFYPMVDRRHYVFEHRYIMAKHLGRRLQKWEIVHHKNGIKDDNRIENLELTTLGNHSLDHNKGYRDGYQKGLEDGRSKQIQELRDLIENQTKQIRLLQWQINESKSLGVG